MIRPSNSKLIIDGKHFEGYDDLQILENREDDTYTCQIKFGEETVLVELLNIVARKKNGYNKATVDDDETVEIICKCKYE